MMFEMGKNVKYFMEEYITALHSERGASLPLW